MGLTSGPHNDDDGSLLLFQYPSNRKNAAFNQDFQLAAQWLVHLATNPQAQV